MSGENSTPLNGTTTTKAKAATKKMAAVSVISNPLSASKDGVLIFQSGDQSLGLRVSPRNIKDDAFIASIGSTARDEVVRPLIQPSQLVAFRLFDTVRVYGMTDGPQGNDQRLQMLSPVQEFLDPVPFSGALAGCSQPDPSKTGGERAWLYMLSEDDNGVRRIIEWDVSKSAPDERRLSCSNFHLETNLYAVYDDVLDTCWLIYQRTDKTIVVHDTKKDKSYEVDNSASRVIEKTALAAAIVPKGGDGQRRLVVYFIDSEDPNNRFLSSANAILGQKTVSFDTSAERPKVITVNGEKQNLIQYAGMSTVVDTEGERVVLFALTTKVNGKEANFKAMPQPWSKFPGEAP